jgi:mono/diheme cytochrome c family protein
MKGLRSLVLFSASCFFVAALEAQLTSAASGDPAKGKILYETNCLACHGERGKGDGPIGAALRPPPADLTGPKARAKSDKDLLTVIRDGRAAMPAWKNRLKEQEIQNVFAYIRSLGE